MVPIGFYLTRGGRSPVEEFIRGEAAPVQAAIARALDRIRERGFEASGVSLRQVRGRLGEIRVLTGASVRIFCVIREQGEMVLLHAYRKRSQKTPAREREVAERRMREVLR